MVLTGFDLYRYTVPLVAPLTLGDEVLHHREGVLVRLKSLSGAVGWGDASPLPGFSRERPDEVEQQLLALRQSLSGWVITDDWVALEGTFAHLLDTRHLTPSARFGLELAAWSLYAAEQGTTLPEIIAPQSRRTVSLNGLLMGSAEEVLENARRMRAAGYRAVKLKVGRKDVGEEAELVHALRKTLGPTIKIRLDANRAWSMEEAVAFEQGVLGTFVEYIEEPLVDPTELPGFAARYDLPVALDETLVGLKPGALVHHTYARAIILKPTLLGGLVPTLRLAHRALTLGMTPVVSAAFETGLGSLLALCALAAGIGDRAIPAGLDTYRWLAADVLAPRPDFQRPQVDVTALMQTPRTVNEKLLRPISPSDVDE